MRFLNSWHLPGAFAYTHAFALLERTLILLLIVIVATVPCHEHLQARVGEGGQAAMSA